MTLLACGSRQALTAVTADLEHRRRWVLINGEVAFHPQPGDRNTLGDSSGPVRY